ncbi:heavy metal transporter [bacterium]|nr:MAG: heavy metal transporter [bacterium]
MRVDLVRRAVRLSWLTVGYNVVEGLVSVYFGLSDDSMALAGFGADSFIEVFSALLVLWRFRSEEGLAAGLSLERERSGTFGIGALFLLLAAFTALGAALQLSQGRHPDTALPGLLVSAASLGFMAYLWRAKRRLAVELDSATVAKDADCSLACIKLSLVLMAGSLLTLAFPALWWADAAAALVLSLLIAQEGAATVRAARRADFSGGCGCASDGRPCGS